MPYQKKKKINENKHEFRKLTNSQIDTLLNIFYTLEDKTGYENKHVSRIVDELQENIGRGRLK